MENKKDVVTFLKSLGLRVDVTTPGKVMVSSGKRKPRSRRGGAELGSTVQGIVLSLNAAKDGTLLGTVAEAMRTASQIPGRISQRVPYGALNGLADSLRKLDRGMKGHPLTVRTFFTSQKPVRLLLSPHSNNRDINAVFKIIRASEAGVLDRVKACGACQQFFVARRDVDRFCKPDCKSTWHRQQPGAKEKNAEYQARFRKSRKELDRGALAAARVD